MWTIQCSAFPVLPIAVSALRGPSTRRPSSGQSGGSDSRTPSEPLDPPHDWGLPQWRGRTFYGDDTVKRKAGSGALHLVQHLSDIVPLGASGFARRGKDLGDKLGAGHHTSSLIEGIDKWEKWLNTTISAVAVLDEGGLTIYHNTI